MQEQPQAGIKLATVLQQIFLILNDVLIFKSIENRYNFKAIASHSAFTETIKC